MKSKHLLQPWTPSLIAGLAAASLTGTLMAQNLEQDLATFDTDASALTRAPEGSDGGLATTAWDASGNPGGSLKVTINWSTNNASGWHEVQLNFDQSSPPNIPQWLNLEYDVKIDQTNSALGPNGNYGFTTPILNGWSGNQGWTELGNITLIQTDGWQHISASLASYETPANDIVIRLGSNGGQNVTNTVVYYIDNIRLVAPPLPPPTLAGLKPATPPGLTIIPCTSYQYQRVMVYPEPVGTDFGWYNRGSAVTYSFTITNFPTVNDYAANVYLIPNGCMQYTPSDTAVDWNCTNGVFFNITANTNNPATNWNVDLSVKTNLNAGNPNLQLINFDYAQLPTGTWTLRFDNNTDFTIIAPDGFTTNGTMTADVADLVSGNSIGNIALTPYFGIMPRTVEHIGVPCVYSRIQIQGVSVPLDDTFSAGALDTNVWSILADYPAGVKVLTSDLWKYITWDVPNDQGFSSLAVAGAVNGPWTDLVGSSDWLLVNPPTAYREALISKSALNAALGGSEDSAAYFVLMKRSYAKLQLLFPGEFAAPGTPTGKTGTRDPITSGAYVNVTINAVDSTWHIVNVSDTITLASSAASDILPLDAALVSGSLTQTILFDYDGSSPGDRTITASDTINTNIPPATETVTVTQ